MNNLLDYVLSPFDDDSQYGSQYSPRSASEVDFLFAVPKSLRPRLMRIHNWSEDFTNRAMKGYLQFMKVKLQQEDWDAKLLSPSLIVHEVWVQHLLYPKQYRSACKRYTKGNIIDHDPEVNYYTYNRVHNTRLSLKALFGKNDIDPKIWSFGPELDKGFDYGPADDRSRSGGSVMGDFFGDIQKELDLPSFDELPDVMQDIPELLGMTSPKKKPFAALPMSGKHKWRDSMPSRATTPYCGESLSNLCRRFNLPFCLNAPWAG
ncbi:expressed unknown protein [Seminavis robusta]|uniref:Uncharacterized protein n=1 Tax=Seminavis robusta TaxID=568900 RepID=A0A9N8HF15_9STRA|nr:expressed unknown protein [Seminavis robusta]|eukprot:Sro544_g163680.1 n/a (262) ;mRNA; f:35049-36031